MESPIATYLESIHASGLRNTGGTLADYIPELANHNPDAFGLALCTPFGTEYSVGDTHLEFSIQSVSKPFVYAMALADRGIERIRQSVGEEPSGDPFNSISLDEGSGRPDNPMINIGALTTHALVHFRGATRQQREERILAGMSKFAGRQLHYDEKVYSSEIASSWRNLALAALVRANDLIVSDPAEVVAGYTRQCAIAVTVKDLAVMGMTLASGGINPKTGERVVPEWVAQQTMSVMTTCGMYDSAGDWLSNVGIPAKSGVSGCILGALPGLAGVASFSPPIDSFGNSVRGVEAFEKMSVDLGLHMLRPPSPNFSRVYEHAEAADGSLFIDVTGSMDFAVAERALRALLTIEPRKRLITIDYSRVPSMSLAGYKLLLAGMRELDQAGHTLRIVDPVGYFGDFDVEAPNLADIHRADARIDATWSKM